MRIVKEIDRATLNPGVFAAVQADTAVRERPKAILQTAWLTNPAQSEIPGTIMQSAWLSCNLVEENGQYFPQLNLHVDAGANGSSQLLEEGMLQLRQAGYTGEQWRQERQDTRVRFCRSKGLPSARQGFLELHYIAHEACKKTQLGFGRNVETH